ncbi:hypothetical protein L1987_57997 [Smallanthus sonchifolius]|uniref:Uncharacterized protein n=1 Tax=Smallanthus sonchifolius TaxID=185202 RepID=A0ACB9DEI5_9ASTR|nr:hypothetical protein L1987_57997 [Smallanthus sonchifolius]
MFPLSTFFGVSEAKTHAMMVGEILHPDIPLSRAPNILQRSSPHPCGRIHGRLSLIQRDACHHNVTLIDDGDEEQTESSKEETTTDGGYKHRIGEDENDAEA